MVLRAVVREPRGAAAEADVPAVVAVRLGGVRVVRPAVGLAERGPGAGVHRPLAAASHASRAVDAVAARGRR